MSFVKTGDKTPILDTFDSDGKIRYCSDCGRKLKAILIAGEEENENELICECQIAKPEELN